MVKIKRVENLETAAGIVKNPPPVPEILIVSSLEQGKHPEKFKKVLADEKKTVFGTASKIYRYVRPIDA